MEQSLPLVFRYEFPLQSLKGMSLDESSFRTQVVCAQTCSFQGPFPKSHTEVRNIELNKHHGDTSEEEHLRQLCDRFLAIPLACLSDLGVSTAIEVASGVK